MADDEPDRPGRLSANEFLASMDVGLLPETIELDDGRVIFAVAVEAGVDEFVFPPKTARAIAERLGIRVRTCVDAVMEDSESRNELLRRILDEQRDDE
jgi:predicted nucleic acid-binding protein